MRTDFVCASCGERHDVTESSFVAEAPAQWHILRANERVGSELGSDQCVIESEQGTSFYIRAQLEIPIVGTGRVFTWGVWCSLSERSFAEMSEHWTDPGRTALGPYFGWLCTPLPEYPDTMFLKTMVHQRDVGLRPWVELERTEHPLAVDQRDGIAPERIAEMVQRLLHGDA